jgi:hypothetical protein
MTDRLVAGLRCSDAADLAAGFVLGALEPAEMDSVRAHLAACPEPHPEFAELGAVVPALLASVEPVEPRAALGAQVMAAVRADAAAATDTVAARRVAAPQPARLEERTRSGGLGSIFRFRQPVWAGLGVAAVLAIVVLGASNLQLRSERDQLAAYERAVATVTNAATDPEQHLAVLTASAIDSPTAGLAAVSTTAGTIQLAIRGLAPTAGTQVYEAWYVPAGGAPLPIGDFTVGSAGTGTILGSWSPPSGTAPTGLVAITLEPASGATTPTKPILASGAAS